MLPFASTAFAQDVEYTLPADEMTEAMVIMEVMFPADTREDTMVAIASSMGNQVAESMMEGPIFAEPGIRAIVDQFLADLPETMRPAISKHLPAMIKATAIAYTREFTLDELRDLRNFAETPTGQRYFESAQSLLNDPAVARANQAFFQEISVLQEKQSQLIQEKVIQYLQDNPDVLERLNDAGIGTND